MIRDEQALHRAYANVREMLIKDAVVYSIDYSSTRVLTVATT